jgi:hypothetical protein
MIYVHYLILHSAQELILYLNDAGFLHSNYIICKRIGN